MVNVVSLVMVFIIQNTQNTLLDSRADQADELIRAHHTVHNAVMDLETLSESELDRIKMEYAELAMRARKQMHQGRPETGTPDLPDSNPL